MRISDWSSDVCSSDLRLLTDLLPLFDSMEAGLAAASPSDPLREGLELTLRQLHRIAAATGLTEVAPAAGEAFAPERHQEIGSAPSRERVCQSVYIQVVAVPIQTKIHTLYNKKP